MITKDVIIGKGVKIFHPDLVNFYGCEIGDGTQIGPFVEIQKGVKIGSKCKISSHSFFCDGVTIGDGCFIGHGVMTINTKHPRAITPEGNLQTEEDWKKGFVETKIGNRVSIGSGAVIMGGVRIGDGASVGAGAVVTKDVPPGVCVVGVPARPLSVKSSEKENDWKFILKGDTRKQSSAMVPFVDLKTQTAGLYDEVYPEMENVIKECSFILGDAVSEFEENFAEFCGVKHAVAVNSGTSALVLALICAGVGSGDEVITVPNTFVATVEAILQIGAKPVFVDVDSRTYTLDAGKMERAITRKTKAIIPVHLYGQSADMDKIMEIAERHNLKVIEDACQAHGAEYKGKRVGGFGIAGCFSFYPGKNLGCFGEGGALVTNNDEVATQARMLRDHGQSEKYISKLVGFNYRMHGIQGAVLKVKLRHLEEWNEKRRKHAETYNKSFLGTGVNTPFEAGYGKHVYHIYSIITKRRDRLKKHLESRGISTGIHYPIPVHLQEGYAFLGHEEGDFPVAERAAMEELSLPMYPELTEEQIKHVVDSVKEFLNQTAF
jgi:dTDP-4-amino-4,6-dideoxygalactose transaminase/acetyltransferase-like isoleucine patch superfamily enzyme